MNDRPVCNKKIGVTGRCERLGGHVGDCQEDVPGPGPCSGEGWRHYEGTTYSVLYLARHTDTNALLVIYTTPDAFGRVFARPYEQWQEIVEHEGVKQPRFVRVWNARRMG